MCNFSLKDFYQTSIGFNFFKYTGASFFRHFETKRTARLILDQDPIAPSEPLFKQLGWMSIEQSFKYHKYLLVSKCLKNEAPVYLKKYTNRFSKHLMVI
jgi:hypothetical protein